MMYRINYYCLGMSYHVKSLEAAKSHVEESQFEAVIYNSEGVRIASWSTFGGWGSLKCFSLGSTDQFQTEEACPNDRSQ